MDIGERLRTARKAAGLTQEGVARRAGLTLKAVGEVERGEVQDPHYSTLTSIAHALGMTVAELVGEETAPKVSAPPETGPPDHRKGPDPDEWGADEDRPKVPMPESAGKRIHVQLERGQVTITETAFLDLIRAARAGRLTEEDARQRLLDESA